MADIVNLRQARKQKARDEKTRVAEQNRALHGRSKAEKQRDRSSTTWQASQQAVPSDERWQYIALFSLYFSHSPRNGSKLSEPVFADVDKTSQAHPQW